MMVKRALLTGAAIAIALAAAIPLWLVLDDGGVRRLGSIDPTTVTGAAGRLTIAGVNGGVPLPIDSFSFRLSQPAGATRPEVDEIDVILPLDADSLKLLGPAMKGTNAETAKVELVRSFSGTPTAYLTFDLTNVTIEGLENGFSDQLGGQPTGQLAITLKYGSMEASCIPSACAQPEHQPGTASEIAIPDLGPAAVRFEAGTVGVPKDLKTAGAFKPVTVVMELNYLLLPLWRVARGGEALKATVKLDLVRGTEPPVQKRATYKLGGTTVTGLTIGAQGNDFPVMEVEFAPRQVGVTAYSYTNSGVLDKSASYCWDVDRASSVCPT